MYTQAPISRPDFEIEYALLKKGYTCIAGIDEAGRGALAGPLCVGAVVYSPEIIKDIPGELSCINDSKKLLPAARIKAVEVIERYALAVLSTMVSHRLIDRCNINRATEIGIQRLCSNLPVEPEMILIDGNFNFRMGTCTKSIIKGDSLSLTIASASIIAKVRRDRIFAKFEADYPGYDLGRNKGYGTLSHREAIKRLGPVKIHRKSYEPIKSLYFS